MSSDSDSEKKSISSSDETNICDDFDPLSFFETQKERCYYKRIISFFKKCETKYIKKMVDIINGDSVISLRILDWFVTKYSKKKMSSAMNSKEVFDVHNKYKAELKSHKKRNFDPFRRRKRFYYTYDIADESKKIETTLGQLNFFRWAIRIGVIDFVENHIINITKAMNTSNKEDKKRKKDKKRKPLYTKHSETESGSLNITTMKTGDGNKVKITLSFD